MDIKAVQEKLNALGLGPLKVDGDYGPKTIDAVRAFQKKNLVAVDGVIGVQTAALLFPETIKEITKMDSRGLAFLSKEEGVVLKPYRDSVGIPTIGVGCTYYENGAKVRMTDPPISMERALALFANLLKTYELCVYSRTRDDINQNQFNALVSLCFNIGEGAFKGSTLLKKVNANPKDPSISATIQAWRNAGGKPILLKRRIRESELYFS